MKKWLRKLRGIFGIGAIFGLPATVVGAVGGVVASYIGGASLLGSVALGAGMMGGLFFSLGCGFAALLSIAEGRRTLQDLSPSRAAVWGGVAGGVLPVVTLLAAVGTGIGGVLGDTALLVSLLGGMVSSGGLGAVLAGGAVALARQDTRSFPSGSAESRSTLLSAGEKHNEAPSTDSTLLQRVTLRGPSALEFMTVRKLLAPGLLR